MTGIYIFFFSIICNSKTFQFYYLDETTGTMVLVLQLNQSQELWIDPLWEGLEKMFGSYNTEFYSWFGATLLSTND